jgi:hypothetical protein
MNKIAIVGRGTVGCMTAAHFLRWSDWQVDWIYDPAITPAAVGEGTTLALPRSLSENLSFDSDDMLKLSSTPKMGIAKRNWGQQNAEYNHPFPSGSCGMHFNAVTFQDYVFNKLKDNPRLNLIEKNASVDNIDADKIIVCTGSPTLFDDEYALSEYIPVNACVVSQCPWDMPRFLHTLTYAMPWGWVFGIPLQNRCAIGYLYNDKFVSEEQIKEEVKELLEELKLIPNVQRSLKFNNYYRKNNFTERVAYNGNASFFLEPLEATSTGFAHAINTLAVDVFSGFKSPEYANEVYHRILDETESMICMHYFAGSTFKNEFWDYAESMGRKKMNLMMSNENSFSSILKD